jgi:hypothetical protein
MTAQPDIFTNVHKGIRSALFQACTALGRAGDDPALGARARALLRDALHFVAHHGDNEDSLLVPLLREHAPSACERLERGHAALHAPLERLRAALEHAPPASLYAGACHFLALYLEHMREEEAELDPVIRAHVPAPELAAFGARSVARTAPADQRLMLGWMLPAMTPPEAQAFLVRLPSELREELAAMVARAIERSASRL